MAVNYNKPFAIVYYSVRSFPCEERYVQNHVRATVAQPIDFHPLLLENYTRFNMDYMFCDKNLHYKTTSSIWEKVQTPFINNVLIIFALQIIFRVSEVSVTAIYFLHVAIFNFRNYICCCPCKISFMCKYFILSIIWTAWNVCRSFKLLECWCVSREVA